MVIKIKFLESYGRVYARIYKKTPKSWIYAGELNFVDMKMWRKFAGLLQSDQIGFERVSEQDKLYGNF